MVLIRNYCTKKILETPTVEEGIRHTKAQITINSHTNLLVKSCCTNLPRRLKIKRSSDILILTLHSVIDDSCIEIHKIRFNFSKEVLKRGHLIKEIKNENLLDIIRYHKVLLYHIVLL